MALPEREENDPLKVWLSQNKGSGNVDFGSAFKWVKDVASDARDQVAKIPGVSPAARIAKRSLTEFNNMFGKTLIAPVTRNALALSVDAGTIFEYVAADVYESNFNRSKYRERVKNSGTLGYLTDLAKQTLTYQVATGENLGTGYLPGGDAFEQSQAQIAATRPTVGTEIFTLGRAGAYPLVKLGVIRQDGTMYKLISGGLDAYKIVKNPLDPFNQLTRIRPAGISAESRVATGGLRVAEQDNFIASFDDLETRVQTTRAKIMANRRPMTPDELDAANQYDALTRGMTPSGTRTIADPLNPNKTIVANSFDPLPIYTKYARDVDDVLNGRLRSAGLNEDVFPAFVRNQYQQWVSSGDGTKFAQDLIDNIRNGSIDAGQLWRRGLNREGIQTAVALVDEIRLTPNISTDRVLSLIEQGVASMEPGFNLRKIGRSTLDAVRQSDGNVIKYQAQKAGSRQLEVLPESLRIGFSDPNGSAMNLDNLMGSLGFDLAERNDWLAQFGRAISGDKSDLFEYLSRFEELAIGRALASKNISLTPEQLRELTSWTSKTHDEVVSYTLDALGEGVPLPHIDHDGIAPLRLSQLMGQDRYLMPKEVLDKLVELTGTVGPFKAKMKTSGNVVGPVVKGYDEMTTLLKAYMSDVWKPRAVAKPSHTLRIVPEEVFRGAASGIFEHPGEQILMMLGAQARTTATGEKIASKIPNLTKLYKQLDEVQTNLDEALGFQRSALAGKQVTPAEQRFINRIPEWEKQVDDIQAKLNTQGQAIFDVMIGPRSRGAMAASTGEYAPLQQNMLRQGQMELPSKAVGREQRNWVNGVIHELTDMFTNQDYRRIAKGQLFDTDKIEIGGVNASISQHVQAGTRHPFTRQPIRNDIDAVKLWLFQGEGRQYFDGYFDNIANLKPAYRSGGYDTYTTASERVQTILDSDIRSITGMDPVLLEVIAEGTYQNARALIKNMNGRGQASKELVDYIKGTFMNSPHSPKRVKYYPERKMALEEALSGRTQQLLPAAAKGINRVYTAYFEGLYGLTSDALSRVPSWKANYWLRMEEVIPLMTKPEAALAVEAARKARLSAPRMDRIRLAARLANGEGTVAGADLLAKHYAIQATNDLLYNANKRSLFGQQHRLMFAFFEAYREVTASWLKLSAMNPRIIRNVAQFADTSEEEGWYYANLDGRKVFEIPMSGAVANLFAGDDGEIMKNFTVGVNAVNVVGQGRPGFGPTVQFAVDSILPKTSEYQWLRSFVAPFGSPELRNPGLIGIFTPSQVTQMTSIINGTGGPWEKFSDFLLGDRDINDYHQKAVIRSWQYLINNNPGVYLGPNAANDAMEDAENLANKITFWRGLTAFVGPGAPLTEWLAKTEYGTVEVSIILEDLYKKEEEARSMGEPSFNGFSRWIELWGKDVWAYATTLSKSNIGGQIATREFEDWASDNEKLLGKYPDTAGYFAPRGGERSLEAWLSQSEIGRRDIKDLKEARADAEQKMGNYLYYDAKSLFTEEQLRNPANRQQLSVFRNDVKETLPLWNPPGSASQDFRRRITGQILDLSKMVKDPLLAGDDLTPIVSEYLDIRKSVLDARMGVDPKLNLDSWYNSNAGRPVRDYLRYQVAPYLMGKNPRFVDLWEQVLSYEFIEDEE
jgi:hypothetical protein